MDLHEHEDIDAHFRRLLRENAEHDRAIFESSKKAIEDSRRLLAEVARDHPDIA